MRTAVSSGNPCHPRHRKRGTMKRSGMVGSRGARRFRRRAADARRHLNIKKEDDLKVNLTF